MKERDFQGKLIKKIKELLPGTIVIKNDASYIQGIPDLLVLYGPHWAALECKQSSSSPRQPNQEYYVSVMNEMSFARFIDPENEEEILHDIQRSFQS